MEAPFILSSEAAMAWSVFLIMGSAKNSKRCVMLPFQGAHWFLCIIHPRRCHWAGICQAFSLLMMYGCCKPQSLCFINPQSLRFISPQSLCFTGGYSDSAFQAGRRQRLPTPSSAGGGFKEFKEFKESPEAASSTPVPDGICITVCKRSAAYGKSISSYPVPQGPCISSQHPVLIRLLSPFK